MPYYHVRIGYIDPETDLHFAVYKMDLSEYEAKEIGKGYKNGQVLLNGKRIKSSDIKYLQIRATKYLSSRYEEKVSGVTLSGEVVIFAKGRGAIVLDKSKREKTQKDMTKKIPVLSKNVFIVHGRDHKPMKELKIMLKEFSLDPIVLHEQPSGSRTIVEKLEKYSDVGYAFVILTPDDLGCFHDRFEKVKNGTLLNEILKALKGKQMAHNEAKIFAKIFNMMEKRARQNVVLEFGYFIGLLSRDRVCCLYKGDVELPSDMHGIVYIPFKESINEVKDKIVKELKEAGYKMKI